MTAHIPDLQEPRCEVRRAAVEKLGAMVSALEVAADDEKSGSRASGRCLGVRLDDTKQKILARR